MSAGPALNHPQLGQIEGVHLPEGGIQFRNLVYAAIPERWQHSVVVDDLRLHATGDEPYDATKWGPMAPQPDGAIDFDFGLIQKSLPLDRDITCDETKCLNLVVTTPCTTPDALLPVIVFIHGGGFFLGSNSWPQYDLRQLVKLAASNGKPFVGVGINYRLGLLGSLASRELTDSDEAGNFGLNDQANALRWIQRHISGFGGDPQNVTVMGESAGAISVWMHFLRGEPIFTRGVCMSGDPRLLRPQTLESAEAGYRSLLKELDVEGLPAADRVAYLRTIPWQRLVALPHNARCLPTLTNGFQDISWDREIGREQIRSRLTWCKTLVIGDCELDGTALAPTLLHRDWLSRLNRSLGTLFSPEEVQQITTAYRLDQPLPAMAGVHPGLIELATDVRFYMPIVKVGQLAQDEQNVHIYHFHEPNPFEGPFTGRAGHVLDIAYALQTYRHLLPLASQGVSIQVGEYVIDLACGALDDSQGRPVGCSTLGKEKPVLVWDSNHKCRIKSPVEYDRQFRRCTADLLTRIGVEKCARALDLYQAWNV